MKKLFTIVALSIMVLAVSAFGVHAQSLENKNVETAPAVTMTQEDNLQKIGNLLEDNFGDELKFFTEVVFNGLTNEQVANMTDEEIDAYLEDNYGAMIDDFLEEAIGDITEQDIDTFLEEVFGDITEDDVDNFITDIFGGTSDADIDNFINKNFAGKSDAEIDAYFDNVVLNTFVELLEAVVK